MQTISLWQPWASDIDRSSTMTRDERRKIILDKVASEAPAGDKQLAEAITEELFVFLDAIAAIAQSIHRAS